jgi:hypothetical protein
MSRERWHFVMQYASRYSDGVAYQLVYERESDGKRWVMPIGQIMRTDEIVHRCPPIGSGTMPCCGRTPFERMIDRLTLDPTLVTCEGTP